MTEAEGLRLVAMLTAYFRQELSEHTGALWARELGSYELEDGMEAAQILGTSGKFMPALSEFIATIEDCARVRRASYVVPVLPEGGDVVPPRSYPPMSFEQFLRTHPEYRERTRKLGPVFRAIVARAER